MDNKSLAQTGQRDSEDTEIRECRSCYGGGQVLEDVFVAYQWTETVASTCPICKGAGEVSVWLYPAMRKS